MNFVFRLFLIILRLFDKLLRPVYWVLALRTPRKIPPIQKSILLMSATQLAEKIRKRKLSSEFVVNAYIERIKEVNPIINAVIEDRFEAALEQAKSIDEYMSQTFLSESQLERIKPFFGVPITIKESCGLEGMSQAVGLVKRKGIKCLKDCITAKRLKKAGFIPLLVSATPEFCIGLETFTHLHGLTCNPYNTNHSVGGSSGGEAALLGSGCSVVGIGTDFAGSIRIPCLFNGIFGHKPTPKIVDRTGHFPESEDELSYEYFGIGPMTRYAEDLRPLLKIIVGEDGLHLNLDTNVMLSSLKIYHITSNYDILGIETVDEEIQYGIKKALLHFKQKYDNKIDKLNFKDFYDSIEIGTSVFLGLTDKPNLLEDPKNPKVTKNLYIELLKGFFNQSHLTIHTLTFNLVHRYNGCIPKSKFPYYWSVKERLQKQLIKTLGNNGVLLYPSFPTAAFQNFQIFTKSPGIGYSCIFNLLGCPTTQVPIGLNKNKMPIGFQVVAAPNQDRLCIAVAEELEKLFGGWVPPYET